MAERTPGRTFLIKLLEDSSRPVYLMDENRRLLFANRACRTWLQVADDEVQGIELHYKATDDGERTARWNFLCPPPEVWRSASCEQFEIALRHPDGDLRYRTAWIFPLDGIRRDEPETFWLVLLDQERLAASPTQQVDPLRVEWEPTRPAKDWHTSLRQQGMTREGTRIPIALIGESTGIRRARSQWELIRRSPCNAYVWGPDGVPREAIVRGAWQTAVGASVPVLPLDCGVLDEDLLQTIVQSFLRRERSTPEAIPTVVLLDAHQLADRCQACLVELLRPCATQVRILATADRDLWQSAVFSRELAAWVTEVSIEIPPLTSRVTDIPPIVQALIEQVNGEGDRQVQGMSRGALELLMLHPWRSDLEELETIVRDAHRQSRDVWITEADLPDRVHWAADADRYPSLAPEAIQLTEFLESIERELIDRALQLARGNRAAAARLLGITRSKLLRKLGDRTEDGESG